MDNVSIFISVFQASSFKFSDVNTSQVQQTVNMFMAAITILILVFLAVHVFMRFHYKAKTEYAIREFSEKFEKQMRGPSPYAIPQADVDNEVAVVGKPMEVLLEPAQLAPILHHVALAPPQPVEQPNQSVFYTAND